MKPIHLIVMAIVLVALILVGTLSKSDKQESPSLAEQADFVRLFPSSLTAETVTAVEFATANGSPSVRLVKQGNAWQIASAWNAPAKTSKIDEFLKTLLALQGEFRTKKEEVFSDYGMTDAQALRIRVFAGKDTPDAELWVGKKSGYGNGFVRKKDDNTVYSIDKNLRNELGLWGDDLTQAPEYGPWLNKELLRLKKDNITRMELRYPDHRLLFAATQETSGESANTATPPATKTAWTLAEGGPGATLKKTALDTLLSALESLDATDVADPQKKAEYGLETPNYACVLTMNDGDPLVLQASRKTGESSIYLTRSDTPQLVYTLNNYTFERIFPKASSFFTLDVPRPESDAVTQLALTKDGKTLTLTRKDKDAPWALTSPAISFPLQSETVSKIVETLATWTPLSYADATALPATGLEKPVSSLTLTGADGKAFSLGLGNNHAALEGRYVRAGKDGMLLCMGNGDADNIFPALEKLFTLKLFTEKADDIVSLHITPANGKAFRLEQAKGAAGSTAAAAPVAWEVVTGRKGTTADTQKVQAFIGAATGLSGETLLPEPAADWDKMVPVVKLQLKTAAGTKTLSIRQTATKVDGAQLVRYAAQVDDKGTPVIVPHPAVQALLKTEADFAPTPTKPATSSATVTNPFAEAATGASGSKGTTINPFLDAIKRAKNKHGTQKVASGTNPFLPLTTGDKGVTTNPFTPKGAQSVRKALEDATKKTK